MATLHFDVAFNEFQSHLSTLRSASNSNEASTRLRAIDTLLFSILMWDKANVTVEEHVHAGYADYVFRAETRPRLVLEAKKDATTFFLPSTNIAPRPYYFGLLNNQCPAAGQALRQAMGYATEIGAQFSAISNGHQWLLAMTFVANRPLDERPVIVFPSIDSIKDRFSEFCECFSEDGVKNGQAQQYLLDELFQPPPPKLSKSIPGFPVLADRNVFQNELAAILDQVWQVTHRHESTKLFIEKCYVNPSAHNDILSTASRIITRRRTLDEAMREPTVARSDQLSDHLKATDAERPIVILGEIGRGKSTFLDYLRYVGAANSLNHYIQITINFLDRPDFPEEVESYIYQIVEDQLYHNYDIDVMDNNIVRGVLHKEIHRLKKSPTAAHFGVDSEEYKKYEVTEINNWLADKHRYLGQVVHHLKKGRQHSLAIYFDNLDRVDSQLQERAFLKASAIARDWACLVFVCLRPKTFFDSRQDGTLDAIAPITFTVGQPDLALVLKRRFSFAKEIANGTFSEETISVQSTGVTYDLPSAAAIFEHCEFGARKRNGIIPTLEAVSNGNIRRLLDLARQILSSGHLDTRKIVDAIHWRGSYILPDFEGVKTLLYGDYIHYSSDTSLFINLFDIQHRNWMEHFIRPAILLRLPGNQDEEGVGEFVNLGEVVSYLTGYGFPGNSVRLAIEVLAEKDCIRYRLWKDSSGDQDEEIAITALGRFHLFSLMNQFQYIDGMILDTPVLDDSTRSTLKNSIENLPKIGIRIERTRAFINYLNKCSLDVVEPLVSKHWEETRSSCLMEMSRIENRARR